MSTLRKHTLSRVEDLLANEALVNEVWEIGDRMTDYQVRRLISEGTGDDHDEIVVVASMGEYMKMWSSDPEYPFDTTDPHHMVFFELPEYTCNIIEEHTGLDMSAARPK